MFLREYCNEMVNDYIKDSNLTLYVTDQENAIKELKQLGVKAEVSIETDVSADVEADKRQAKKITIKYKDLNKIKDWLEKRGMNVQRVLKTLVRENIDSIIFWFAKTLKQELIKYVNSDVKYTERREIGGGGPRPGQRIPGQLRPRSSNIPEVTKEQEKNWSNYAKTPEDIKREVLTATIKKPFNELNAENYPIIEPYRNIKDQYDGLVKQLQGILETHFNEKVIAILDYIFSPVRTGPELNFITSSFEQMYIEQEKWHKNLKADVSRIKIETHKIIKAYKDGFYWVDLETNNCREEAEAMGHCGRTSSDTLLSLRQRTPYGIQVHVTSAWDYAPKDKTKYAVVYQMKGKNNQKPIDRYHPYIVDLLLDKNLIPSIKFSFEYSPKDDFHIYDVKDPRLIQLMLINRTELFINEPLINLTDDNIRTVFQKIPKEKIINDTTNVYNILKFYELGFIDETKVKNKVKIIDMELHSNKIFFTVDNISKLSFMFGNDDNYDYQETFEILESGDFENLYKMNEDIDLDTYNLENLTEDNLRLIYKKTAEGRKKSKKYSNITINEFINKDHSFYKNYLNECANKELIKAILNAINRAQIRANVDSALNDFYKKIKKFFGLNENEPFETIKGKGGKEEFIFPFKTEWMKKIVSTRQTNLPPSLIEFLKFHFKDQDSKFSVVIPPEVGWVGTIKAKYFNTLVSENIHALK